MTIGTIGKISVWNTLRLMLQARDASVRLTCFRGVYVLCQKGARISGHGTLHVGRPWESSRIYPSEFRLFRDAKLSLDGVFTFVTGSSVTIRSGARMNLGSGYINSGARIDCADEIRIGNKVWIGYDLFMRDSDGHDIGNVSHAPIVIRDHVWIGTRVTILKGVEIGEGAVVATGAVVTSNVVPYTLVAGVPAKTVKTNMQWK